MLNRKFIINHTADDVTKDDLAVLHPFAKLPYAFPGSKIASWKAIQSRIAEMSGFKPEVYHCCVDFCCAYTSRTTRFFFFFWWSAIYDLSRIGPQRGMLSSPYGHANRPLTRLNPAGGSGYGEFKPRALNTNQGGNVLTPTSRASGAAVLWK